MVQEISSSVRQSNGHSVINMCSKNKPAIAIRLLKTTSACITNNRGRGGGVSLAKTEKTGCGTMRIQKERKERKTRSKENQSTVAWTRRCCRI